MAKFLIKCCKCKKDIILELKREPFCIETLATYIGFVICDKCAGIEENGKNTNA